MRRDIRAPALTYTVCVGVHVVAHGCVCWLFFYCSLGSSARIFSSFFSIFSFSFIFFHFLCRFYFIFFFFFFHSSFLSLSFNFLFMFIHFHSFSFIFFFNVVCSKSDIFLGLNFATISLDSSYVKNQLLGPSRGVFPSSTFGNSFPFFSSFFFLPFFCLFSCFLFFIFSHFLFIFFIFDFLMFFTFFFRFF